MLAARRPTRSSPTFAGQWLYLRNSRPRVRTRGRSPTSTTTCVRRSGARRSCSSTASCARIAARSICCARTTPSSTSAWPSTTAFPTYGSRFRRVSLGDDSVRGGILGQGSVLTVTSYANRTSPVLRGKWILENIVGTPPPPPPQNVPPLKDTDVEGRALDARTHGAASRESCVCRMPSVDGSRRFSMENFDAIGRWRIRTESGSSVDASGGPRRFDVHRHGRTAAPPPEMFVGTLTEKLLTYGLAAASSITTRRPSAKSSRALAQDYRFSRARHRLE